MILPFIIATFIVPIPILWICSAAIFHGISSARDEHHRMTPQSPWFYFNREARRYFKWSAVGIVVLLFGSMIAYDTVPPGGVSWKGRLWGYLIALALSGGGTLTGMAAIVAIGPRLRKFSELFGVSALLCTISIILNGFFSLYALSTPGSFFAFTIEIQIRDGSGRAPMDGIQIVPWIVFVCPVIIFILLLHSIFRIRFRLKEKWMFSGLIWIRSS